MVVLTEKDLFLTIPTPTEPVGVGRVFLYKIIVSHGKIY